MANLCGFLGHIKEMVPDNVASHPPETGAPRNSPPVLAYSSSSTEAFCVEELKDPHKDFFWEVQGNINTILCAFEGIVHIIVILPHLLILILKPTVVFPKERNKGIHRETIGFISRHQGRRLFHVDSLLDVPKQLHPKRERDRRGTSVVIRKHRLSKRKRRAHVLRSCEGR